MTWRTALELGRVSNLPTVWTNVLAGVALAALEPAWKIVLPVGLAASLLYVAGMYLDEAFNRGRNAAHRAERPIPQGEVSARVVFKAGFGMMAAALAILAVATDATTFVAGLVLTGLILLYDVSHEGNRVAPAISMAIMGLGRVAVYGVAASASGRTFAPPVIVGAVFLFLYLVMVSMVARQENQEKQDPKSPRLVGRLVAGISLVDGVQLLVVGQPWIALACVGAFFLTLGLQKRLAAT
jgi:4-hydroxybenzoate polyprenyltransferase